MSRVSMQSPAGDAFYPLRVERTYFNRGDVIVAGDPLYDLAAANGRQLRIRASHAGRALTLPIAAGDLITAPEDLIEIDTASDEPGVEPKTDLTIPAWDDDVDDEVWDGKPKAIPGPSPRRIALWLGGLFLALILICAAAWLVLSYMPLASDRGDSDGYFSSRAGIAPLGGKRRLFVPQEQEEGFAAWLAM